MIIIIKVKESQKKGTTGMNRWGTEAERWKVSESYENAGNRKHGIRDKEFL